MDSEEQRAIRIVFMGSGAFAMPALQRLDHRSNLASASIPDGTPATTFQLAGVVTKPDQAAGRGRKTRRGIVATYADSHGIPVFQPLTYKNEEAVDELAGLQPDILVVASYGLILPRTILGLPRLGALNLHPSLLPRHRGPSPVAGAILAGDHKTGATVMEMVSKMDAGPIVAQCSVAIDCNDTTESLTGRLSEVNAELLDDVLPIWVEGCVAPSDQDELEATYTPLLTKEMGRIDWAKPAEQLAREVRAFVPWPVCHTILASPVRVFRASVVREGSISATPGTVLAVSEDGVLIQTGESALIIEEVQPAGGRRMAAADLARGRSIRPGTLAE